MAHKKTPNIDFMMAYVKDYLDGKTKRQYFDLDIDHYIIKRYAKMEREDPDFAQAFGYYISERGVDCGVGLSDAQHKRLIRRQYEELISLIADGFY